MDSSGDSIGASAAAYATTQSQHAYQRMHEAALVFDLHGR
jgi:hypothetical protein